MAYIIILRLNSLGKRRATTSTRANFLSILQEKTYLFYFTDPLLQNTHISLSILHIYLIKYSFFLHFLLFYSLSSLAQTHHFVFSVHTHTQPATLQQNSATDSPIFHNNNHNNNDTTTMIHRSSITTTTQSQQLWPAHPPCPIDSLSLSPFPNGLLDWRGWSAFPTHLPPKLADRTQSVSRKIAVELSSSSSSKPKILKKKEKLIGFAELRWEKSDEMRKRELRWESDVEEREEINKIIINELQYPCKYTPVL